MILRSSSSIFSLLFLALGLCLSAAAASPQAFSNGTIYARAGPALAADRPTYVPKPASELACRPFGVCEPCPEDELNEPFCMPFGNRRLLHCIPAAAENEPNPPGEVPAWESCGKVIKKEQRDFYEFVTANLLFLIVCLVIYGVRTSALATQQYRQLAARIGIPSGSWQV